MVYTEALCAIHMADLSANKTAWQVILTKILLADVFRVCHQKFLLVRLVAQRFITRQHAMHAECNIVLPILSVRLSVHSIPVLCLNEWTYRHIFWQSVGHHSSFFCAPLPLQNSKGNPQR